MLTKLEISSEELARLSYDRYHYPCPAKKIAQYLYKSNQWSQQRVCRKLYRCPSQQHRWLGERNAETRYWSSTEWRSSSLVYECCPFCMAALPVLPVVCGKDIYQSISGSQPYQCNGCGQRHYQRNIHLLQHHLHLRRLPDCFLETTERTVSW